MATGGRGVEVKQGLMDYVSIQHRENSHLVGQGSWGPGTTWWACQWVRTTTERKQRSMGDCVQDISIVHCKNCHGAYFVHELWDLALRLNQAWFYIPFSEDEKILNVWSCSSCLYWLSPYWDNESTTWLDRTKVILTWKDKSDSGLVGQRWSWLGSRTKVILAW